MTLPTGGHPHPNLPYLTEGQWQYLVQGGKVVGKRAAVDFWGEVRALWPSVSAAISEKTPVWKTKIVLLNRAMILDVPAGAGIVRERRAMLNRPLLDEILLEVGRFQTIAEAYGAGTIKLDIDLEVELENIPQFSDGARTPFARDFVAWYFEARLNSGGFTAEDAKYRGPYDSVFFVHPAPVEPWDEPLVVRGSPVSSIPLFTNRFADEAGGLSLAIFEAWRQHVRYAAQEAGYRLTLTPSPQQIEHVLRAKGVLERDRFGPDYQSRRAKGEAVRIKWTDVSDDPLGKLPWLSSANESQVVVPVELSNYVGGSRDDAFVSGIVSSETGLGIQFESAPGSPSGVPQPTEVATEPGLPELTSTPTGGLPKKILASPNVELKDAGDSERSGAFSYFEAGIARFGRATLFSLPPGSQSLQFWVRSTSREPLSVFISDTRGELLKSWTLGRLEPFAREIKQPGNTLSVRFNNDGKWHRIVLDVRGISGTLSIGPSTAARYAERDEIDPIRYDFDAFQLGSEGASPPPKETVGAADSASELERAKAASTLAKDDQAVLRLLSDSSRLVILNAAYRLSQQPNPVAELRLRQLANDVDPLLAWTALDGLRALSTPSAELAIRNVLDRSPFELNRAYAAGLLKVRANDTLAGPISLLYASRSWYARYLAAEAIAGIKGKEAPVILMVFLQEIDPTIRLLVISRADASVEVVTRRLGWSGLNDPSDAVRGASYAALVAQGLGGGAEGLKDPSVSVRIDILRAIAKNPNELFRGAALEALKDKDPRVRLQGLRALSSLPIAPTVEEMKNVLQDPDPRVQLELVNLARRGKIKLSTGTVAALRASPYPDVAESAKELEG